MIWMTWNGISRSSLIGWYPYLVTYLSLHPLDSLRGFSNRLCESNRVGTRGAISLRPAHTSTKHCTVSPMAEPSPRERYRPCGTCWEVSAILFQLPIGSSTSVYYCCSTTTVVDGEWRAVMTRLHQIQRRICHLHECVTYPAWQLLAALRKETPINCWLHSYYIHPVCL